MADGAPDLIDAGVACARLIADPRSWINRRFETVEMLGPHVHLSDHPSSDRSVLLGRLWT